MESVTTKSKGVTFEVSVVDEREEKSTVDEIKGLLERVNQLCLRFDGSGELSEFLVKVAQASVAFRSFVESRGSV